MLYGEIEVGDILEWKTFGGQSTTLLVTGHGEIIKYGPKKGADKKIIPAVYVRSLHAFDDDPEMVEISHLRQNCKRVEPEADTADSGDGDNAAEFDAKREDDSASSETVYEDAPTPDYETVYDESEPPPTASATDYVNNNVLYDDPKKNKKKSKIFS